jgi:hypothetical protein
MLNAFGEHFHPQCFNCSTCENSLLGESFSLRNGERVCKRCATEAVRSQCRKCTDPLVDKCIVSGSNGYHLNHFTCSSCAKPLITPTHLSTESQFAENSQFCETCFGQTCHSCKGTIKCASAHQYISAFGVEWHIDCFVCSYCNEPLGLAAAPRSVCEFRRQPYCEKHHQLVRKSMCVSCGLLLKGQAVQALDEMWHQECFRCSLCRKPLQEFASSNKKPYCNTCYMQLFAE